MMGLALTLGLMAVTPAAPDRLGASACGDCHGTAFESWRSSAHAVSATNAIYRAGFRVEPRQFCVDCHTSTLARAEEGIGCASCHAAAREAGAPAAGHAVALRARADLRDPALCRDCHEFATPAFEEGAVRMTSLPMQRTYSEWLAYRAAGGAGTCQSCHMPGGDHGMRGAHDPDLLRRSLAVTVTDEASGARLTLASAGVGHGFPTGDLFRHLTVEVRAAGDAREDAWRVVDRMGRRFETRLDGATMRAYKVETADTALVPGVPRVVALGTGRGRLEWRVRYHYGSERDERRGVVTAEALFATLATGTIDGPSRARLGQGAPPRADYSASPRAAWPAFSRARSRRRRAELSLGSRATAALYSRSASR
ncbi:MAG TPA: multiheme c-type cytochrome [Polyangia bacterium]|nr:multiheme c-type cytochrome [Polyangia bacterium]